MDAWDRLLSVSKILLGPNGCPWDRQQTLRSLQPYILEEAHELIETIDAEDPIKMKEELGDFLYTGIFVANLAEAQKLFSVEDSLREVTEKLIRRHPHIFSDTEVKGVDDVMENWEAIKQKEGRKTLFEGIPPTLPALARAQKMFSKLVRQKKMAKSKVSLTDDEIAEKIMDLVYIAESLDIDVESLIRRACKDMEKKFEGE